MKLAELHESSVSYTTQPNRRFRVSADVSFKELVNHPDMVRRAGPNTHIFDATEDPEVKKSPGDNKWNAMAKVYGYDEDEIACAYLAGSWLCLAIGVKL